MRVLRLGLNLTLDQFADEAALDMSLISLLENGKVPGNTRSIQHIASVMLDLGANRTKVMAMRLAFGVITPEDREALMHHEGLTGWDAVPMPERDERGWAVVGSIERPNVEDTLAVFRLSRARKAKLLKALKAVVK